MITKLRQKVKNNVEKDFLKFMNNAVFEETMKNMRKHRIIKLVSTETKRNYLVSEPSYYTTALHCACKNRLYLASLCV